MVYVMYDLLKNVIPQTRVLSLNAIQRLPKSLAKIGGFDLTVFAGRIIEIDRLFLEEAFAVQ